MKRGDRRARVATLFLLAVGVTWAAAAGEGVALAPSPKVSEAGSSREKRPNIVLVLTDDQRADSLWAMPNVRRRLVKKGTKFENGYVSNSLCCPSRTSILTGQYSHSTGVYTNSLPDGGFGKFSDASTVATWLHEAGYRTGLIGKYLNGYNNPEYVAPGWDEWRVFANPDDQGGEFYDYQLSINGDTKEYGHEPEDYSTDVLAKSAARFIRSSEEPFFLYFSPFAPHGNIPAPRHLGTLAGKNSVPTPSWNEEDVSDKPLWVQERPLVKKFNRRLRFYETLIAVDEAVAKFMRILNRSGERDDTFFVFTSDNGKGWGEHRWGDKSDPYRGSTNVPYIVRYDPAGVDGVVDSSHLVLNLDLAPTFSDLAGADAPNVEGRSLLPLFEDDSSNWREDFLLEHLRDWRDIPSYCGVRTLEWLYVAYETGEEELYNLELDPYELENRADDLTLTTTRDEFRARVQELCSPPPPGYAFPFESP